MPPINFISCYGKRKDIHLSKTSKNVFWTGENISDPTMGRTEYADHMIRDVDLALGFEHITAKNYVRFPVWYMNYTRGHDRLNSQRLLTKFSKKHHKDRPIPCSLIARHDHRGNGAGYRQIAVDQLTKVFEKVYCEGRFISNSNLLHARYNNSLAEYLEDCKFNICLENSSGPGYTTEKLFHALAAGCVPIYWSGETIPEPDLIEPESYIVFDPDDPSRFLGKIEELHSNANLFYDFINQRKIKPNAEAIVDITYHKIVEALIQ